MVKTRTIKIALASFAGLILLCAIAYMAISVLNRFTARVALLAQINTTRREAIQKAQKDPRVIEVLGIPIVEGTLRAQGEESQAVNASGMHTVIPINGPNGSALLHVQVEWRRGETVYLKLDVEFQNGAPRIDLLTSR